MFIRLSFNNNSNAFDEFFSIKEQRIDVERGANGRRHAPQFGIN